MTLHRCTSSAAAAGSSAVPSSMVCQAGSGCLRCQSSYSLTSSPQTPTSLQGPQTIACRRSGWRPRDNPCLSELARATDWPDPSRPAFRISRRAKVRPARHRRSRACLRRNHPRRRSRRVRKFLRSFAERRRVTENRNSPVTSEHVISGSTHRGECPAVTW